MAYAIKTEIRDMSQPAIVFTAQKTMYGGKHIAKGDELYLFASENAGGKGLVGRGVVTLAEAVPRRPGIERQTPRVSITVKHTAPARRALGRAELKPFADCEDGKPEKELYFKFYRQATDKIIAVSDAAAEFLNSRF